MPPLPVNPCRLRAIQTYPGDLSELDGLLLNVLLLIRKQDPGQHDAPNDLQLVVQPSDVPF